MQQTLRLAARYGARALLLLAVACTQDVPAIVASATKLTITTQLSATAVGGVPFTRQPVIQLRDAANAAVAANGVAVTVAIGTGGGTLGGTTTVTTNASGVATFSGLSISGADGSRTLTFSSAGLTGVSSNGIAVTSPNSEPVYIAGTHTLIMQDNMDQYTSVTAMGEVPPAGSGPVITPIPSPSTTSQPVETNHNQLITGRGGSGKALRMVYSGVDQDGSDFTTLKTPSSPDNVIHNFQFYARMTVSSSFATTSLAVKWFEAWHNHVSGRIQWNTRYPSSSNDNPRPTVWQVIDRGESPTNGDQPIGPYFEDLADGVTWHRFTFQFRPNSATGARDGFARMWINGVKVIDVSAATIGVTPPGGASVWCSAADVDHLAVADGIGHLRWGATQTTDTPPWTFDIDDFIWWRQ